MNKLKAVALGALLLCGINLGLGAVTKAEAQKEYCGAKCYSLGTPPECGGGSCRICFPDPIHGDGACIHQ